MGELGKKQKEHHVEVPAQIPQKIEVPEKVPELAPVPAEVHEGFMHQFDAYAYCIKAYNAEVKGIDL